VDDDSTELKPHVRDYLCERSLACLPEGVLKVLNTLTAEELAVLDRVGASLEDANADLRMYVCAIH
jgi:hypothetical protein